MTGTFTRGEAEYPERRRTCGGRKTGEKSRG